MKNLHGPYLNKNDFFSFKKNEKERSLNEHSILAYILTNPDGSIVETNHVAENMFGYSKNEFHSLSKNKLFNNADNAIEFASDKPDQYRPVTIEATGIKKNGECFPIELTSVIYAEPDGEVKASILVYDLSKQGYKENDRTGKSNHEPDFKQVIESITDGFFTLDNDWIITYWNTEIEKISGIKKETIVGKSFLDFFKNIGNLKLYSECSRAKRENISIRFEEFYESSCIWIEIDAYPSETGLTVFCKNITDQKTAEAAMKISNERYNMVVKATNDLVWDWDILTGEIYRSCDGVKRVYGHSSNESIKTNELWAANIHPEDRESVEQQISYYISSENESSFNFEYRYKTEDGNYNYINDKGHIIRNNLGIVIRMIGAARNITAQKQAARKIEESEQRYKMFLQQSTEGIWRIEFDEAKPISTSVEEMISYCMSNAYLAESNDAFAKMYGYENAEQIIGIPLNVLMPEENPVNIEYLRKFFSNNFKVENEISYECDKDGNRLTFINNMVGVIEGGMIKRAWGTQRNITDQKKVEESLLASEEQYRYLFNNNPSCIFIWNLETLKVIEANEAAIELYGYSRKEFLQLSVLDLRPKEDQADFLAMVKIAQQNETYKKTKTWRHIIKNGDSIFMEISSHNINYKGERAVLAIGNNVTDKIQLENSLNEERQIRQKQITDAVLTGQERERSELGEELHDNINQILASTRLYIECALKDDNIRKDLLEKGRVLLDSAMKEIRKLSRTLLPPSLGEVSLLEALNDLTNDTLQAGQINIKKDWEDFTENGLSQKLRLTIFRIVQEQLSNVYKHAKAKNVMICLERKEGSIRLSIKDDGVGFNILTKRTGVGLRNITSRAEVNNGTVSIDSTPGKGCEMVVEFLIK